MKIRKRSEKTVTIQVRFNDAEYRDILDAARLNNKSISLFIADAVFASGLVMQESGEAQMIKEKVLVKNGFYQSSQLVSGEVVFRSKISGKVVEVIVKPDGEIVGSGPAIHIIAGKIRDWKKSVFVGEEKEDSDVITRRARLDEITSGKLGL